MQVDDNSYQYYFAYYTTLKRRAREIVAKSINAKCSGNKTCQAWRGITLSSITQEAIDHSRREWPKYYSEDTHNGFNESWERIWYSFNKTLSFFDIAIWQTTDDGKILRGMAIGRPSKGKTSLTIHWAERSFIPIPFKGGVLRPMLGCAEEYARLLGSRVIYIKDPVDTNAYERYGYRPTKRTRLANTYLMKELEQ